MRPAETITTSVRGATAGFAERIAVPVWNLVLADQTLSFEEAAMVEPAAVALHALNRARIRPGDWVAVYGAGPIGLMVGEFAKIAGASNVILVDIDDRKLAFARSLGYQFALNSTQSRHLDEIMQLTSGKGVDLAVECAGVSAAYAACLRCVKTAGGCRADGESGCRPACKPTGLLGSIAKTTDAIWHLELQLFEDEKRLADRNRVYERGEAQR